MKTTLFRLVVRYVSCGTSFCMASELIGCTYDVLGNPGLCACSCDEINNFVWVVYIVNLQQIVDLLRHSWAFSLTLNSVTHQSTSFLDLRFWWLAPKFFVRPKKGPTMLKNGSSWNLVPFLALNTRRGRGACWGSEIRLGRGTSYSLTRTCIPPTNKLVSSHFGTPLVLGQATGNFGSLDSPRPRLGGSHHLPPYSILCTTPRGPHPNGLLSRDSQVGVPKLSRNCPCRNPTLG
jgi:hypothetical protein